MNHRALKKRLELEKLLGVSTVFQVPTRADALSCLEARHVRGCTACRLSEDRTQTVFGVGDPTADLMFIGEAPGADEDRQGEPFVGRAGKLLDKMIEAMGLERPEVYITNIVKCRPPQNRDPREDEVESCRPYLRKQIEIIEPSIICTLGRPAGNEILDCNRSMGDMRNQWSFYRDIPVMPTYHPAYLLRSPGQKRKAWLDLKKIIIALHEGPPTPGGDMF